MNKDEVKEYFDENKEFKNIPLFYQNRIIDFFCEDRHYFVDPVDIRGFLTKQKTFVIFKTMNDLKDSTLNEKSISGILGCKRHFESVDELGSWEEDFFSLKNKNCNEINFFLMTHAFGFELDSPEEWYIASYV